MILNDFTHSQAVRPRFRQLAEARRFAETEGHGNKSLNRNCIALFTLALIACSGKPYVVEPEERAESVRTHRLFVASHGWHTGIVVPARDLNEVVPELENRFGAVPYYEVGWGDKKFYQAREATTGLALQAIFRSEGVVLHVVGVPTDPRLFFAGNEVLETCISESGMKSLKAFLAGSFSRDSAGRLSPLSQGLYRDSQFYLGEGRYHLMNTSNKWTAKALRSAGMGISPAFKLTAGSVMSYLRSNPWPCEGAATAPQ
jgi:uncharacterized protein (TIGR02117 family)